MMYKNIFKLLCCFLCFVLIVNEFNSNVNSRKVKVDYNNYMELSQKITSDKYFFKGERVFDILANTKKDGFLSNFKVDGGSLSLNCDNGTDYVGSACQIKLLNDNTDILSYDIVVQGDVTGDGNSSLTDMVQMMMHSKKIKSFSKESYLLAGDLNVDNVIDLKDVSVFSQYSLLKKEFPKPSSLNVKPSIEIDVKRIVLNDSESFQIVAKSLENSVSVVEWRSLDEKVAKVDNLGLVTGVGNGSTTIEAVSSDGDVAIVKITVVVLVKPTGITFNQSNLSLVKGASTNVGVTVSPSDAYDKSVVYSSDNPNVVTIDPNGLVEAVGSGTTKIRATTVNGYSAELSVSVTVPVSSISLNKTKLELDTGKTATLVSTVKPDDAVNKKVVWSSSNTSVAKVDKNGVVTAVGNGTAIITATSEENSNIKANCTVSVTTVYTSLTKLGIINLPDERVVVSGEGDTTIAQGFCIANDYYVAALRDKDDINALIKVFNRKTGKLVNKFSSSVLGHANGMTFDGTDIFIAHGSEPYKISVNQILNDKPTLKSHKFYNSADDSALNASGVAYDKSNGYYYLQSGWNISVYDSKTQKVIKTFQKVEKDTAQDIGASNGKVLVIRYNALANGADTTGEDVFNPRNAIDIYRAKDGAYLGSYTINFKYELESIDYTGSGNEFALYFYISKEDGGAIYKVNFDI